MLSKDECIEILTAKGFSTDEVVSQMQLLINYMQSVKVGKDTLNCVYNGKKQWQLKNNSKDLNDYLYSLSSVKSSFALKKPTKKRTKKKSLNPITLCTDCEWQNTNRCPAYDVPMNRTSLRIRFCNCGKELDDGKKNPSYMDELIKKMKPEHFATNKVMIEQLLNLLSDWSDDTLARHQCISIFTTLCIVNHWMPDTKNYDNLVMQLYEDAKLDKSKKPVHFDAFDLAMGQYLS